MIEEPDIQIGGFSMRVLGLAFPSANDFWDGNMLRIDVRAEVFNAYVKLEGVLIHLREIEKMKDQISSLYEIKDGHVNVQFLEPALALYFSRNVSGQVGVKIDLSPDPFSQKHSFTFGIDQTFLPSLVSRCKKILTDYPMKSSP